MNRCRYFLCYLLLLGACAHRQPVAEKVTPPDVFKVHPGLLGEPVPPELQPVPEDAPLPAEDERAAAPSPS
ncbi:MAG: hypothetical protein LBF93_05400 [Zoogloeaceae bacterium]|jgi:hypothetical protein|nr:hypothetical protein [Zoogloeaceae bacterium]